MTFPRHIYKSLFWSYNDNRSEINYNTNTIKKNRQIKYASSPYMEVVFAETSNTESCYFCI